MQSEFQLVETVKMTSNPTDIFDCGKELDLIRRGKDSFRQTHFGFTRQPDTLKLLYDALFVAGTKVMAMRDKGKRLI